MALFRQLRLLLWKNGLVAIRQPVWSLTLIIWPLIIFIILAVTRNQFPPVQKDTCYVSPRNLPSAGFFPFLQTLMCNTDSSCNNESYLVDPAAQKTRSTQQRSSPLGSLVKGAPSFDSDFLKDINPGTLLAALKDIYGAPVQQRANNVSSMNEYNTLLGDQEFLNQSQGSVNVLKRAACTMILPMINTTSSSTLNYAVAAYCQSNNTVLEVSLRTLNQILTELMVTKPDEMLKKAGVMMEAFDQLQNHPALWESLLAAPRALSSGSPDQVLGSTNDLLTHLQGALHVTKGNFSDTDAALSSLHPVLVGGINMINYIQNWPGKNVSVSLGDIIALQNDSISEVVKHVLPEVQIPLHQAIVLAWDKDMARSYVCNNGSNSVFVTAACSTGTMDILLSWISPYKVATQALLAWSKDVAPQDVAFVKGLLHSMTEGSYPGGQGASTSRARRSIDTQPQNIEEELFLSIGQVVLEIIEDVPEVDMFVQSILRTSFQVMTLAAEDLEGAEEMMVSVLKAFELLQPINRTLANESDSNVWMDYVMDEVTEIIMKSLTSESLKCEDLLVDPFEWLLNNQSIIINMWMSMICQSNYSTLQQVLLMDWPTLMQKAQEIYSNLTDQATYNVTLHMVLSEWQELKSHSLRFQALLERLTTGLGQVYWMNWTPDSGIHNATGTLLESVFLFMVNFGEKLEESQLWPKVKDYFHTIFWILSYRPNVSIHPANCSFDNHTMALHCDTGLNWPQFVQAVAQALMSPSKALVNCLNGTLNLLEYVYGDIYKYVVASNLTQEIKGEDVLSAYLNNLTRNLDGFFQMASIHPDRNTSNPHVMLPLLGYLLQPTGLTPLLPLFFSDDPINASTVIDIASNLGRSNQHIFIFNDTDPSVPELEQLLMQFFSLDGNLTLSISHIIGYSLLSYYNYFNLEDVAHLRESIQPFKNETSAGLVGILRAMELLKTVIDSQNGDPVNVTLLYIRQLQELVMSLCKFQKIKQHLLPSGQMSVAQVIGPQMLSKDFFNFLTPENLQNLTRAGPDAAQNILIQTFVAFLPAGIQQKAARFLQHFQALQYQITKCAEGQNCSDDISNIFTFLDQILDMMRSADGNASINITGINTVLGGWENEEITSTFFSLLLSPDDAAEVETFKKIFYFIRLITATQNISLSDIQTTLGKLNLTLDELNNIAALAGTDNINDLMDNIMEVINARQCFEPQNDSVMTTRCVMGFITRISRFLTHLPDFYNETDFIPIIFNETFSPTQFNLSSNPSMLLIHALNSTLINIKMRLHLNQSNTHEIMEEIEVLERLIKLAASMDPFTSNFNTTLMTDPKWAQNVYQEIVEWYLKRLENITSNSSIDFIRWIMAAGNISLSDIQTALEWSNLTLDELSKIAALAKGASIYDLMVNIKEIINARKCFEPQNDLMMTTQCVIGFINGISRFLTHLPDFSNETDFLSLIPLILNETFSDVVQVNVSSNPNMFIVHLLNSTLANIKMSLQLNQMNTSEIMNEIKVLEDLMQLLDNTDPFTNSLNTTLMENPIYAQKVSIEIVEWYLKRLENITSNTSVSELLRPYFYLTQMQLTFQLAQTDFSLYVSNQIQFLIDSIPHPIDGEGVIKIGYTVVEILQHLFNITKDNPVLEPLFKTIILNTSNHHTELYLDLIEKWMEQPNVTLILTNILQWGNSSMNVSNQMTDIQQLQQTVANFLSDDQLAYLAMIGNITRSLSKVLMVAEQPGGLQSDHFLAAILEVEKSAMQLLTNATGHMPLSVQQDILEIVQYSLKLLLQPDVSFASSHNISLLILKRAENIIQQTIPGMFADYLLYGLKVATTYFEGIATAGGPEHWNDLVLNEMKTVQSILPPNSTVQAYISLLINITHFILETGQGNRSLWEGFEGVSVQNATIITEQMGKLLSILWPLGMGGPNSNTTAQSLEGFSSFVPILEQIITCQADNDTWDKLEKVLEALLSTLEETELLDNASSGMPLFEKSIGRLVNIIQAQNVMMASLQKPLVILMREIVQSVNTSHYNFSQVLPGMQHAIDSTIQAAQCNGTLKCSEALNIWDPVIEAAGLSYNTMAMWCNISLQPALEASVAAQTAFSNLSMSDMGEEPMTESATAARIVKTVQSLYQVWVNETLVTEQLIMAFSNEFSELFGHRLSPEVQLYWQRKLQEMHMQTSVSSMRMLSDELRSKIPSLQPYTDAGKKALDYILNNYNLIKNGSSSEDFFRKAAMIFLTSVNISPDIFSEMWGNWSGVSESSYIEMMRGIIKLMGDLHILRDAPTVYQAMEKFLESNDTSLIMQKVVEMSAWWNSTEASRLDLVTQALPKICDTIMPLLPLLNQMGMDIPANLKLCDDLAGNMAVMLRQLVNTSGLLPPMAYEPTGGNHMVWFQQRHKGPWMPMRSPMDDFIDLFYINYSDMFKAISVPPTTEEIMETAHMFFGNPDLSVVLKGATGDMQWGFNDLQEDTIDAGLGMLAFLTLPITFQMSPMDILTNATDILPDDYSFSSLLKNITIAMATESQELLNLKQHIIQTANEIFQTNLTDPRFTEEFDHLRSQVCALENTKSAHLLMSLFSIEPGQLCNTFLPSLQFLIENRLMNMTSLADAIFDAFIGDPITYTVQATWSSVLAQSLKFNTSSLKDLNVNMTSPGTVMVGEMLRNQTAFVLDVQQYMDFNLSVLHLLMETPLPNSNKEILSWLANLHQCSSASMNMKGSDVVIFNTFCSMSTEQWYTFSLLVARHLNLEKFTFRLLLCEELQSMMGVMLQLVQVLTDAMDKLLPSIGQLQKFLLSIEDLSLGASNEFKHTRHRRSVTSSEATFVTLSRALCSNGITALFAISEIPSRSDSSPSSPNNQEREEIIERFKIPRNATPYCTNMFLEMVSTTGGAIAWAFLKPMLMGQILYTPDTDVTRAIMEKSNDTLHEFANLAQNSGDWIKTSGQIVKSAEILSHTLPMLQNSLSNAFVKNFIELHTDINVDRMKETIGNFSDMTMMLNQNKRVLDQISTLSNVLVNISSCIKFDRYRGYDSADQLDAAAQELAKNRELYAGVIFKLPKEDSSWNLSSSTSPLPPIVSYTIRMHMDNVIRTDRTRDSYFMKHPHMLARKTMRYNRGFVYLQENLDRAIIEIQTRQKVTEPAVQLQAFPYPCHLRDEYLDGISFNFPTMMMMAWVLFVADFVKKKVHERELRLHEYMKMMGVNPLSHFFAWFLESAAYLLMTIIILTLVLKHGRILPNSDGFILFLYFCDYGFSILAFSYLVSSFFDQTYIAGLSGSLLYILCFFPFLVVMSVEGSLNIFQKSALSLFSPTCFSYAGQYVFRYENQGEGIQWSNSYTSPLAGDTASFGWMCWLMLIDSILYFLIGVYIRMVFPGKYGIPAPWYFPFKASFWADLCCSSKPRRQVGTGLLFTNIMQQNQHLFPDDKGKDECTLSCQSGENFSTLPVGVTLHGLTKIYGDRAAIQNLNVSFYEGHVTSLLGHNGAGKTTTMSLLTGLFAPSSGTIEVYGRDMQSNIDDVRKELGVCMQYDVLFDHMTAKEHLLLYGQIKAPNWSPGQLREQIRKTLEETGMYAHRHKLVGALSGGMKRKLSISIAFIGGSRLVVLDEPTTGVDPCSRRSIWDIIIQNKKQHTIIMSTHHLDEAEVLSDRIAFLEKGGLKCCGSPFYLKEKLGQGYKLTLNKKLQMTNQQSGNIDDAELKAFVQAHVPGAQLKEVHRGDLIYSLPPLTSSNTSSYRSLLAALDSNLDSLQLEGYGISDTTLEEVFLQLTHENTEAGADDGLLSVSETLSDTGSLDSFPSDDSEGISSASDMIKLTSSTVLCGMALTWQQISAILIKRFHHSRRDWKGLLSQILLPVLFVIFAMSLGSIKNNLKNYPEMELSPALYNIGPSYSFFRNQNPNSSHLVDAMMSFPGIDNACLNKPDKTVCRISANSWSSSGNSSKGFSVCKCTPQEQICEANNFQPPHTQFPSSQIVYDLSGIDTENYLVATANDFIRNRYGGFDFGMPLPSDLQKDLKAVPKNRTLSKVWFNPEGFHTMPAYLNSLNNFILRSNLPADKDPRDYAIFVSSHPYFGRMDDEDIILQGMLHILVALCVMLGYSIMTASFAIYEVNEHHGGSKALQHIAGISEPLYWTVNFFYDMVMYMIPVTLTVAVVAAFQIPAFTDRQNLAAVTLLMVLFGFATFPWMYLLSSVFKDAEMAFIIYVCINLFISINTITSTSILYFLSQISHTNLEAIKDTLNTLNCAFKIFPQFNFGNGLIELARKDIDVQILSGYGIDAYQNPFSTESLGWMFMSSFIQGLVFFTLRLLFNRSLIRKVRRLICGRKTVSQEPCEDEDEDVVAEHLRVSSGGASSDILQVNQLTKVYQYLKTKVHAVKRLSVGIPAGECFGLLGVNGAGKTTTFKMLTGDVSPTDGTAQIRDWDGRLVDIMECRNKGINIGYCPQVDALDSLLTGREHLYFYARIRGISKREIDRLVNYLLKRLELSDYSNIITDGYSCGTRRKLSTALALIGHPQILLLDEPSSGMDPRTKRHLWKIISEEVKGKSAVVLTSHSMEECEALCSRLAIMVKGQFRCLGSLQHIKNRFGNGFTVKMYMANASCDAQAITNFMQHHFPSTYLKDQHSTMVDYHVPIAPGGVADIFDKLESNRNTLQIKHFSVSQTTLDEVFINFAMGKVGMETIPQGEDEHELGSIKAIQTKS